MEVIKVKTREITPYVNNSRKHSKKQVIQIAASIKEFGFNNPILLSDKNVVVAGHGRLEAAIHLKLESVPCIYLSHLSESQRKAYVIADNKLAENSEWDNELLALELDNLELSDFEIGSIGFDNDEIESIFSNQEEKDDNIYTRKVEAPIYEITGEVPHVNELVDGKKAKALLKEIKKANLHREVEGFLSAAAARHTIFDYSKIAEYYAHATPEIQDLMEKSALVIIDFDKAIENGFVDLTKEMAKQYKKEKENVG